MKNKKKRGLNNKKRTHKYLGTRNNRNNRNNRNTRKRRNTRNNNKLIIGQKYKLYSRNTQLVNWPRGVRKYF